jgi:hypothetical protein
MGDRPIGDTAPRQEARGLEAWEGAPSPRCLKRLALAGAALVTAGVLFPWQGRQFLEGTYAGNYPLAALVLVLVGAATAVGVFRGRPYHALAGVVMLVAVGYPTFSYFYFGDYLRDFRYDLFTDVPGETLFSLGLAGLGGGAFGLIYRERRARRHARRVAPEAPSPGEQHSGLVGTWRASPEASAEVDGAFGPAEILNRIVDQTWEFDSSGGLGIRVFGLRRHVRWSVEGDELITIEPRSGRERRMALTWRDGNSLTLSDLRHPGVILRLERR